MSLFPRLILGAITAAVLMRTIGPCGPRRPAPIKNAAAASTGAGPTASRADARAALANALLYRPGLAEALAGADSVLGIPPGTQNATAGPTPRTLPVAPVARSGLEPSAMVRRGPVRRIRTTVLRADPPGGQEAIIVARVDGASGRPADADLADAAIRLWEPAYRRTGTVRVELRAGATGQLIGVADLTPRGLVGFARFPDPAEQ